MKKLPLKTRLLLAAAMPLGEVIGFTLHVLHNGLVLEGVGNAVADFFKAYRERTGLMDAKELAHTDLEYSFLRHAGKYIIGLQWFYTLPLAAAAALGWVLARKRQTPTAFGVLAAACLGGGLLWQIGMKQHSMIHGFTIRHADLFIILGFGFVCEHALKSKRAFWRAAPMVLLLILLTHTTMAVAQVECVTVKKWAIGVLIKDEQKSTWACSQTYRLRSTTDYEGTRAIIQGYLPSAAAVEECKSRPTTIPNTLSNEFAAFLLFLR
jgi:hypothetical protein